LSSNAIFTLFTGEPLLQQQLQKICQTTGHVMRSDHTYKVAKSLSVYSESDKKIIQLRASLLVVMNERDEVMGYKLCPTDEVLFFTQHHFLMPF
jgi:hypothetical protein